MPTITEFDPTVITERLDQRPRKWLEDRTGLSRYRLATICEGAEPKVTELLRIARAFDAKLEDFLVERADEAT